MGTVGHSHGHLLAICGWTRDITLTTRISNTLTNPVSVDDVTVPVLSRDTLTKG